MKTHNLNVKTLILIIVLVLAGNSFASQSFDNNEEKKVVKINMKAPLIDFITNNLQIDTEDVEILRSKLKDASFFLLNSDSMEIELNLVEAETSDAILLIENSEEVALIEGWMIEEDYLNTEAVPEIEDWMIEEDYLNTEAVPEIEDWMIEEDYLNTEAVPEIEDWMIEEDYLYTEAAPGIEDWMCDVNYLSSEAAPIIEDWMCDGNHLSDEDIPMIEDWMISQN